MTQQTARGTDPKGQVTHALTRLLACAAGFVTVAVAVACSAGGDVDEALRTGDDSGITAPDGAAVGSGTERPVQNDAQVAHVLVTVNTAEVAQGTTARRAATTNEVRSYAERMVVEHTAANERVQALARQLDVIPQANRVSAQLQAESDAVVAQLESLTGAAFDRTYIQAQVTGHATALELLELTLLRVAQAGALRAELIALRAALAVHLDEARLLQAQLGGDGGTETTGGGTGSGGGTGGIGGT